MLQSQHRVCSSELLKLGFQSFLDFCDFSKLQAFGLRVQPAGRSTPKREKGVLCLAGAGGGLRVQKG